MEDIDERERWAETEERELRNRRLEDWCWHLGFAGVAGWFGFVFMGVLTPAVRDEPIHVLQNWFFGFFLFWFMAGTMSFCALETHLKARGVLILQRRDPLKEVRRG